MPDRPPPTLGEIARQARSLALEDFVARWPDPAFVLLPRRERRGYAAEGVPVDTPGASSDDRTTLVVPPRKAARFQDLLPDDDAPADPAALVFFVKKSDRNPFSTMITLGRARNNDIILDTSMVSKFHAYVTTRPEGLFIHDQGSTNGTTVAGKRLSGGQSCLLEEGAPVELAAGVLLRFYGPASLRTLAQSVAR